MNKEILIKYLSDKDTFRCGWSGNYIETSFDTMPSEFIEFAEKDLQSEFEHKYINALSNAKRALDCQADRLLKLFGFYKESQKKFWGFPIKIELIQKFDILAPRVLNKINKTRNFMEHRYIKPEASQVEDFLDIVSLFIASTEHYVSNFVETIEYLNEVNDAYGSFFEVEITIEPKDFKLIVKTRQLKPEKKNIEFEIERSDPDYMKILRKHLSKIEFR